MLWSPAYFAIILIGILVVYAVFRLALSKKKRKDSD